MRSIPELKKELAQIEVEWDDAIKKTKDRSVWGEADCLADAHAMTLMELQEAEEIEAGQKA